ncbi:hypothetical protein SD70_12350 [Gordoniibacillus kamchatkensis]|uniref:Methionyl-tRNA formyltransferase n=1 Tax=Gordoniibacillus kamchatkensis TaxID=1590651 RepID=A0ABR5AHL6_9BACL|nr:formyltransferase family protein [Paenibacillus sp. VKM B-2647]KIL40544.1 hypothetical protein SD70_12350 [Paenibacillus sp. VKM B-2647]
MKEVVFVGNRFNVLKEIMNSKEFDVKQIYCVQSSSLAKELSVRNIDYKLLRNKQEFINDLAKLDFDILISNGCPYILPVSKIKKAGQLFINIHPSLLPELRGNSPINGALLFNKKAGATCHIMDDGIDTGETIEQIEIDLTPDIDLGLLYQLSFMAESDAFNLALANNFTPQKRNQAESTSYYSRKDEDKIIDFKDDAEVTVRRIKAFGLKSQGAYFRYNGHKFTVLDAELVTNAYLFSKIDGYKNLQIAFIYDDTIVIRKDNVFVKLKKVIGEIQHLHVGDILFQDSAVNIEGLGLLSTAKDVHPRNR